LQKIFRKANVVASGTFDKIHSFVKLNLFLWTSEYIFKKEDIDMEKIVMLVSPGQGVELHIMSLIASGLLDVDVAFIWCIAGEFEISNAIQDCQSKGYKEIIVIVADFPGNNFSRLAKAATKNFSGVSIWAFSGCRKNARQEDGMRYFNRTSVGNLGGREEVASIVEALKEEFLKKEKGGSSR